MTPRRRHGCSRSYIMCHCIICLQFPYRSAPLRVALRVVVAGLFDIKYSCVFTPTVTAGNGGIGRMKYFCSHEVVLWMDIMSICGVESVARVGAVDAVDAVDAKTQGRRRGEGGGHACM